VVAADVLPLALPALAVAVVTGSICVAHCIQPPDGPRLWASPLAVVNVVRGNLTVLADCRNPFQHLIDQKGSQTGGCCDLVLRPADVKGGAALQAEMDQLHRAILASGPTFCANCDGSCSRAGGTDAAALPAC